MGRSVLSIAAPKRVPSSHYYNVTKDTGISRF